LKTCEFDTLARDVVVDHLSKKDGPCLLQVLISVIEVIDILQVKEIFFFFFLCVGDAKSSVPRNLKILCLWVTVQSTDGKLLVDCGTVCCNIRGDYK